MKKDTQHEFALYSPGKPFAKGPCGIVDVALVHRIVHVLRLKKDDTLILFTQQQHALFVITAVGKKEITGLIKSVTANQQYCPSITLLLPLLKKEALEHAIYGAVEVGVTKIQLVLTEKVQRTWGGKQELERLERIMIAAAEQSKCFAFPTISEPIKLEKALQENQGKQLLYADPKGSIASKATEPVVLLVGPEGGLTQAEQLLLKEQQGQAICLTPTILRAQQAAVVFTALIRVL
ncbi:MAG: 16S rRNA (uracil(1498)-N(3))-methyltransferase [Proteobacteria bacterium]|nr:16S rRNA (uracil(1498)-N(3))-methyltransferase [Pseudomonadota bacterium]NBP14717.1 16S rRNA (uracil(1498)-N(3))-methyltransferase [bacterium]